MMEIFWSVVWILGLIAVFGSIGTLVVSVATHHLGQWAASPTAPAWRFGVYQVAVILLWIFLIAAFASIAVELGLVRT